MSTVMLITALSLSHSPIPSMHDDNTIYYAWVSQISERYYPHKTDDQLLSVICLSSDTLA